MGNALNINNITETIKTGTELTSQNGASNVGIGVAIVIIVAFILMFSLILGYLVWQNRQQNSRQDKLFDQLTTNYKDNYTVVMSLNSNFMEFRNDMKNDVSYLRSELINQDVKIENKILDLKTAIIDTKELDSKTFIDITSLVMKNIIYNIEKDIYQIIDRNNLCALSHLIVGEYDDKLKIHKGRISVAIDKNFMDGRLIMDSFKYPQEVKEEIYKNLDLLNKQLNEDLCDLFHIICQDYDAKELRKQVSDIALDFETQSQMILKGTLILKR